MFLTIWMRQFGWISERGGNFLNLLQKEGAPSEKGGGGSIETMQKLVYFEFLEVASKLTLQPNFSKEGGLDRISVYRGG